MVGVIPGEVDEVEGAATADSQQVIFLVGMEIKLPKVLIVVVGAGGRAFVINQIPRVGAIHGDIKKADLGGITELAIVDQVKHDGYFLMAADGAKLMRGDYRR